MHVRRGKALYFVAAALLLLLAAALGWLLTQGGGGLGGGGGRMSGTNPVLDLRYSYDPVVFKPAPYDASAEFPLQLEATDWSFYGKRIRGAGGMLGDKDPAPMLYDFVASQQEEMFSYWYGLKASADPQYEDARLHGRLAVHTQGVLERTQGSRGWPPYFPAAVTGEASANPGDVKLEIPERKPGAPVVSEQTQDQFMREIAKQGGVDKAYIEGWALYTKADLFFFYAVAPHALTTGQRNAAVNVINSLKFNAVLGETKP
ncbi:MAG: hypothetical protein M3R04_00055 [bacterium]|nr:hypothetical protein [bacterium]